MTNQRQIDVYSAGCAVCDDAVKMVQEIACSSCNVTVHDMKDAGVVQRARELGITAVPAVVIDGALAACCSGGRPDAATLRAAGLGSPIA